MAFGAAPVARLRPWLVLALGSAWACRGPALSVPSEQASRVELRLEPAAELTAVPLAVRLGLDAARAGLVEPRLVRGEVTQNEEARARRGDWPQALTARLVPAAAWLTSDGWQLQPLTWLEPATAYVILASGLGRLTQFKTGGEPAPKLTRVFPPPGRRGQSLSLYCGALTHDLPEALVLEPLAAPARLTRGAPGDADAPCVTLELEAPVVAALLPPPSLAEVALEPGPLVPLAAAVEPAVCQSEQITMGPSCIEVEDDRLVLASSSQDLLVVLERPLRTRLVANAAERTLIARGLAPATRYPVAGVVISLDGARHRFDFEITTRAARRHLVLNEVLSNPRGPETAGEWIELFNDSEREASLRGVFIEDGGGSAALPDVALAPFGFALLVSEAYAPSSLDRAPAPSTLLARLSPLATRGLSNSGEPLLLFDADGTLSRFPLVAAPHAGVSIARRRPSDRDDDPHAFGEQAAEATPGRENAF